MDIQMFSFAHFVKYDLSERDVAATADALTAGTGQSCNYHHPAGPIHFWQLASGKQSGRARELFRGRSGKYWLFSGFLLNPDEMIAQLALPSGHDYQDAEIYVRAYDAWGDAVDDRVLGEYAAAAWDPATHSTRLVRSPVYAPPLHYARNGSDHVVSTAPRGVFGTGFVERRVDEVKIADSLLMNFEDHERGWFRNVKRVPLGTRLIIGENTIRQDRFFDPASLPEIRLSDDREYVEAANHLFSEGVRRNLRGFDRPAVSLSGGFDSQATAVTALEHISADARLDAYTFVPQKSWDRRIHKNRIGDEGGHARALCDMYPRLRSHVVDADGLDFNHKLQDVFSLAELPPRNPMNLFWIHEIRARARNDGCDVLLSPDWGNTNISFNGRWRLPALFRQLHWFTLYQELKARPEPGRGVWRRLLTRAVLPNLPYWMQVQLHETVFGAAKNRIPAWSGISPAWAAEHDVVGRARKAGLAIDPRMRRSNREISLLSHGGSQGETGDMRQGMNLISGIPVRDPAAYRPLVEFCRGIPDEQFYRNGTARMLARRMMAGRLPDAVLKESRRGLQGADWHSRLLPLRDDILHELDDMAKNELSAHMFDIAKLRAAVQNFPATTPIGARTAAPVLMQALPRALAANRFMMHFGDNH